MDRIGLRIKQRREELGMTQTELAKKLGYTSKTTIAKIESGANKVSESKVAAYAEALETTKDWLKGIKGPDPKGFMEPIFVTYDNSGYEKYKKHFENVLGENADKIINVFIEMEPADVERVLAYAELVKEGKL